MDQIEPPADTESSDRPLRRILLIAGIVLAVVILAGVAIYAAVFLMLAPMMQ